MAFLVVPLCVAVMTGSFVLGVLALTQLKQKDLPQSFYAMLNATHALYALALLIGVIATAAGAKPTTLVKFLEYMLIFVGGGVLYTRGLVPGGWMHRILNDAPKVPYGMALGNGWNAAAILGYVFFALGGR